jgi:hypothetical protein
MLGGLLLLWILITGFTQKIVTYSDSFAISGFYIGLAKATVLVDDLISVKYQFLVPAGRSFYVSVFSLRARSAPDDFFQIPTYGWSHNRDLFRSIAEMVSGSGIPMDAKTARKLTAISGVVVVPRKVVTRQVAEGATR